MVEFMSVDCKLVGKELPVCKAPFSVCMTMDWPLCCTLLVYHFVISFSGQETNKGDLCSFSVLPTLWP